jgi:hypothetical protein
MIGAVVDSANRVVSPADRVLTGSGASISVAAPPFCRRRLHLNRASRDVATEHDPPQRGPSPGQMDAHRCRSLLAETSPMLCVVAPRATPLQTEAENFRKRKEILEQPRLSPDAVARVAQK